MKRFLLGLILGAILSLVLQKGPKYYKEYLSPAEPSEESAEKES